MTTLTTVTSTADVSRCALRRLDSLHTRPLPVHDAAIIDWPEDQDRPDAWQIRSFNTEQVLSGSFWGMLFAHLFLIPLSHQPPIPGGPTTTSLAHLGLGPERLDTLRGAAWPGTTAAFLLHADDQDSTIAHAFPSVARTTRNFRLTPEEHRHLYAGFGEQQLHAEP